MSRPNRRSLAGALPTLCSLIFAGCFSPDGSAPTTSDSDASTTRSPTSTTVTTPTGATTGTSDATASSGADTSSSSSSSSTSTSTDTTDSGVTSSTGPSSTTAPGSCGDAIIQPDEACDDGPANGDDQPCRSDCVLASCGDGLICSGCAASEACDDGNQIADDACDLECQTTTCGNKVVDPDEECDDGNQIPGDGCSPRCLFEQQFVFVSSLKVNGDLKGLAAADQLCADLAAPKFNPRREFVAWLSDAGADAATRIGVSSFAYKLPTGVPVASNTQDLLDGSLAVPIIQTEDGAIQAPGQPCDGNSGVWTGTTVRGKGLADTCGDWQATVASGVTGDFTALDGKWTQACNLQCSTALRIYCVEKAL